MKDIWLDKGKIKTWAFGHIHSRFDAYANGVRFVCNPRGYHKENDFMGIRPISTDDVDSSAFGEKDYR